MEKLFEKKLKAIYLTQNFQKLEALALSCAKRLVPKTKKGECLVKIASSGVNPSDVLGALGYFSHSKLPRIPGRDFAGVIAEGSHVGKKIWGTGGAAGLDFDGTHAEYTLIPETAIAEIPANLSLLEAGAQTLPYTTAYYSLVSRARIQPKENVLVIGALGQVGRAAMSICAWKGANPIGLVRTKQDVEKARALGWEAYDSIPPQLYFDIILNSIGNLHWEELLNSLKKFGRMVVIAAPEGKRDANIHLLKLYRANQEIHGINSVDLDYTENAHLLNAMKPGFESGALKPLEIDPTTTYPLEQADAAYKKVLQGTGGKRVVLKISG